MVHPADSLKPSHFLGIFPELNTQCREINRHCSWKNKCGCIFWTLLLVVCISSFIFQSFLLVNRFLKYETLQSIREKGALDMEFPDLILCPLNALNITKMVAEGLENETIMHILSAFDRSFINYETYLDKADDLRLWMDQKGLADMEQVLMYFALDTSQMITYCEIQGLSRVCFDNTTNFNQFLTREAVCSVIKPNIKLNNGSWDVPYQEVPGFPGAWVIGVQRTSYAYFPHAPGLFDSFMVRLFKERPRENQTAVSTDNIMITPGVIATIAITEKRVYRLPYPFSDAECLNENDIEIFLKSNVSLTKNTSYSSEICYRDCETIHAMNICNTSCVLPGHYSGKANSFKVCNMAQEFTCVHENIRKAKCSYCKKKCHYLTWIYSYNYILRKNSNVSVINVYHADMTYMEVEDKASTPFTSLVGDIGGQLSLWLGFKVATLVQIFYYLGFWTIGGCCGSNENGGKNAVESIDTRRVSIVMPN